MHSQRIGKVAAALLAAGCASVDTRVDYQESGYDFGRLATFTVESLPSTDVTALASEQAGAVARRTLEAKGFRYVDAEPDFVLALKPASIAELSGWLVQRRRAQVELTAEVRDRRADRVVWRSKSVIDREAQMLPDDIRRRIEDVIAAALAAFPP